MYSNNQEQIRAGLVNYIGAMLNASPHEDNRAKRHEVVAILLEEAMALCKDENESFDLFVSKPALRLTANIIKQRTELLNDLPKTKEVNDQLMIYKLINDELVKVIENTKL